MSQVFASAKPDLIWMDAEHGVFDRLTLYEYVVGFSPFNLVLLYCYLFSNF